MVRNGLRFGIVAAAMFSLVGGCRSLPDGTPPRGNIVDAPKFRQIMPVREAVNYLATSMAAAMLRHFTPGTEVRWRRDFVSASPRLAALPEAVMKNSGDLFVLRADPAAELTVVSRIRAAENGDNVFVWEMIMTRRDAELWRDAVKMTTARPATVPVQTGTPATGHKI